VQRDGAVLWRPRLRRQRVYLELISLIKNRGRCLWPTA
jgi:hypothetical protein